jgi:hypothetical protein
MDLASFGPLARSAKRPNLKIVNNQPFRLIFGGATFVGNICTEPHTHGIVELTEIGDQDSRNRRHYGRPIEQIHERCGDAHAAKELRAKWRQALNGSSHV